MIPKSKCLDCKQLLWDNMPIQQPSKGDISICAYCGCIMEFTVNLNLKRPLEITKEAAEASYLVKTMLAVGISPQEFYKKNYSN